MARQRNQKPKFTEQELNYLAGFYEATLNIRGTNTMFPVAVSRTELWPNKLTKRYGGEVNEFTTAKGKDMHGWFVPVPLRLELHLLLDQAGLLDGIDPNERLVIEDKLRRVVDK